MRIILAAFAVYRLSRFLSFDDGPFMIFDKLRSWTSRKRTDKNDDWQATLDTWVHCSYCQGPYYAALVTVLILKPTSMGNALLTWLGLAGMQDFLETIGRKVNK